MTNFQDIYGTKTQWYQNRKEKISEEFYKLYKTYPTHYFSSPGRIEVLGNHTDHNNGLVLVSAIDLDILSAVKKTSNNKVMLKSEGFDLIEVDLNDLEVKESEYSTSIALIKGVLKGFKLNNFNIGGFESTITSNIFKGAGLSSSAAFELLISTILNDLYNESKVSEVMKAKISQYAENVYFNKPCGLLDQMGISLGGFNYIDFKSTKEPEINTFNIDLDNYRIVLINTGGSHAGLTKYYASIKDDMSKVAKYFNKDVLREVSEDEFYKNLPNIKKKIGGRAILRAIHYFDENKRVSQAYKALKENDIKTFLNCINESGESSYKLLQNCFIDKDSKQGIALALELSKKMIKDGACRVHGGGFKGTIIAYVSVKEQIEYIDKMKQVFGERNVLKVSLRKLGSSIINE